MNYANGREVKVGDFVVGKVGPEQRIVAGTVITIDENLVLPVKVGFVFPFSVTAAPPLEHRREVTGYDVDFTDPALLLPAEDAIALIPERPLTDAPVPADPVVA